MPRITKVYTRTGDDGTTGLGSGQRVAKDALRIEAYGDVDELNSFLGTALACGLDERLVRAFTPIQNELFHLGSDLCIPEQDKERHRGPTIEARHVEALEGLMDELSEELPPRELHPPGRHPWGGRSPRRPGRLPPRREKARHPGP